MWYLCGLLYPVILIVLLDVEVVVLRGLDRIDVRGVYLGWWVVVLGLFDIITL